MARCLRACCSREGRKVGIPALFGLLRDKDEWLRFIAGCTLESLGPEAGDDLLPFLKNASKTPMSRCSLRQSGFWVRFINDQTL